MPRINVQVTYITWLSQCFIKALNILRGIPWEGVRGQCYTASSLSFNGNLHILNGFQRIINWDLRIA